MRIRALQILLLSLTFPLLPFVLSAQFTFAQTTQDRKAEANRLLEEAINLENQGENHAELQKLQQALEIYRQVGDRPQEAAVLSGRIAPYYGRLGQYAEALNALNQALKIYQELKSVSMEAGVLSVRGWTYYFLINNRPQAFNDYKQALKLYQQVGDLNGEADVFSRLGWAYYGIGQHQQALDSYNQSLRIANKVGNQVLVAYNQLYVSQVYTELKQKQQAIESLLQARKQFQAAGIQSEEARTLRHLGGTYWAFGDKQAAVDAFTESTSLYRSLGNYIEESYVTREYGLFLHEVGEDDKALEILNRSLTLKKLVNERGEEARVLSDIAYILEARKQPELSIVFYKESINLTEVIRKDLQTLSQQEQKSYSETIAYRYRALADLLLKQNRVLEAQRVLDLLKVQELDDYLRNVRGNTDSAQGIPNRPPEQQIKQSLDALLNTAIQQGKQLAQLESIKLGDRTEAQKQQILELRKNQEQIAQQFQDFLKSAEVINLVAQLRQTTSGSNFDLDNAKSLQDNLKRLQQDAVILYPFVLDDRLELVLVTPYAPPIRRTVQVKRDDLNRAILNFRTALKNPTSNAKVPAQQLYQWLIKPIENDLAQAKAKTIIYAPDAQLRYIPLAALYDGTQWLTQSFRINNITALSLSDLNTQPQAKLQILAAAFTHGIYHFKVGQEDFNLAGLPFAAQEVDNLTKTISNTTTRLDRQFTPDLRLEMNDYSVIHLATHAAFVVGQPENSFILFGNGDRATFPDIEQWRLPNVDLVVLSACETGLGDIQKSNGIEILGFGYLMQKTGARATIASLWSVDDGGTQALMNTFYKVLQQGKVTKAEALRQAQIAMIQSNDQSNGKARGSIEIVSTGVPTNVINRLSHPYYWAPFILIGNGL